MISHEDILNAINYLGYTNGFAFSGDEDNFVMQLWEHDTPQPTMDEIKKASEDFKKVKSQEDEKQQQLKESAILKLSQLGLTVDEAKTVIGI